MPIVYNMEGELKGTEQLLSDRIDSTTAQPETDLIVSRSGSEGLCVLVVYVIRFCTLNANARITNLRCARSMMKEVRADCTRYRREEGTVKMKCR